MKKLFFDNSVQKGLTLGYKAGFVLSAIYAFLGFITIESLGKGTYFFQGAFEVLITSSYRTTFLEFIDFFLMGFMVIVTCIVVFAIAPSMFLGSLTGIWLGIFSKTVSKRLSKNIFMFICALSCLCIVIMIHVLFKIPLSLSFQGLSNNEYIGGFTAYPFLIGMPSLIYIFTGGWMGLQLYLQTAVKIEKKN